MEQTIKTVSTVQFRQQFGQLTDEVLYGKTWLKVTKNGVKALLIAPWDDAVSKIQEITQSKSADKKNAEDLLKRFEKIRKENSRKTLLIDGMSWSEFVQKDRYSH